MSNKLLRRILCALWQRYRNGILLVTLLFLAATIIAVYCRWNYWNTVAVDAWGLVESLSGGTKLSMAFAAAFPVIFMFIRWLFTRRNDALKHEFMQEVVKPAIGTVIVYALILTFYTIFIAQPAIYVRRDQEAAAASNDLAKLTPLGSDIPYKALAGALAQANSNVESGKKEKEKADEKKEEYWKLYVDAIATATNDYSTYLGELDRGIARARSELKNALTNNESFETTRSRRAEVAILEKKKILASHTELVAPFQSVAKYAVSVFHPRITDYASKCGSDAKSIEIPSIAFMSDDLSTNMPIVVGTNCNWRSSYLWDGAALRISIAGKKSKPATAKVWMDGKIVRTEFRLENEPESMMVDKSCEVTKTKEWISSVDWVLNLLIQSQREEFQ